MVTTCCVPTSRYLDGLEYGIGDGVVTTERQRLAASRYELFEFALDLCARLHQVVRRHFDVTDVGDVQ